MTSRHLSTALACAALVALTASRSDAQSVTLTRVTLTDQAAGELLFRGTQTFSPMARTIAIPVHASITAEGVRVRLLANDSPVEAANPVLQTTTNNGATASTSLLIGPTTADPSTPLSVEVAIPLPKELGTFTTRLQMDVGAQPRLRREVTVTNKTGFPWVTSGKTTFHLRLRGSDLRVLFEDLEFPQLSASRTRWQDLAAKVDSTTMFVRMDQLLDADGTASPKNRAGLPRLVRLENGAASSGVRTPLATGTSLILQGPIADPVVTDLVDQVPLLSDLPLGSPAGAPLPCAGCCCESPVEQAKSRAFLPIGTDPDVKVLSAIRTRRIGLPLSQRDGQFVSLPADEWKLCVTNSGTAPRKLRVFDGRANFVALSNGTAAAEIEIPAGDVLKDVSVWVFSTAAATSSRPNDETQVPPYEQRKAELLAVLEAVRGLKNDSEFRALYCLHPDSRGPAAEDFAKHIEDLRKALLPTKSTTAYLDSLKALKELIAVQRGVDAQRLVLRDIPAPHDPGLRLLQLSLRSESLESEIVRARAALVLATADLIRESSPPDLRPLAARP